VKFRDRVCVEMDLDDGLPNSLEVVARRWAYHQSLHYVRNLFRCVSLLDAHIAINMEI
jgi:hypothetical protein